MKSTQYTVIVNPFVQRDFQRYRVCTQKNLHEKRVHSVNLSSPLCFSAFAHGVYCVLLHRYRQTDNKC